MELPKVIILTGMMGTGKTTLLKKLDQILKAYNFEISEENYEQLDIKEHIESDRLDSLFFKVLRKDLKRIKRLIEIIKTDSTQKIIYDGFLLNTAFLKALNFEDEPEEIFNNIFNVIFDKVDKYSEKYDLTKKHFDKILFINLNNENSFKQYIDRESDLENYDIDGYKQFKEDYNELIEHIGNEMKNYGVTYREVDITNLDINSEQKMMKFVEKNLLI